MLNDNYLFYSIYYITFFKLLEIENLNNNFRNNSIKGNFFFLIYFNLEQEQKYNIKFDFISEIHQEYY
jgi:hypothetical protein